MFQVSSRINSTWGGNLVDMVRCQRYLEIIEEERLVENAATVGAHLLAALEALAGRAARTSLSNARGRGPDVRDRLPGRRRSRDRWPTRPTSSA